MIEIVFRNGDICHYEPEEYTDYRYDGKYFIVIREKQWIGFYNLDCVEYIEVKNEYVRMQRFHQKEGYCEVMDVPKSEVEEYIKNGWGPNID